MQIAKFSFHFSPVEKQAVWVILRTVTKKLKKIILQASITILTWTWLFFDRNQNNLNLLQILKHPSSQIWE